MLVYVDTNFNWKQPPAGVVLAGHPENNPRLSWSLDVERVVPLAESEKDAPLVEIAAPLLDTHLSVADKRDAPLAGARSETLYSTLYIGGPNLVDFRHGQFLNTQLYKNRPYWDHAKIDHIGTRLGGTALSPGQPWDPVRRRRAGPGPRLVDFRMVPI